MFLKIIIQHILLAQYEPRGSYYSDQNVPLPEIGFAGISFLIGIVVFLIGMFLNNNKKQEGSTVGCIFTIGGMIFCIPGLIWVQAIINSLFFICIIILAIVLIISFLWGKIKN